MVYAVVFVVLPPHSYYYYYFESRSAGRRSDARRGGVGRGKETRRKPENIESSRKSAKLSRRHVYVSIVGKCHKQHPLSTDLVIVVELESRVELC